MDEDGKKSLLPPKGDKKRTYALIGIGIVGLIIAYLTLKKLGGGSSSSTSSTPSPSVAPAPNTGAIGFSPAASYGSTPPNIAGLSDALANLQSQYQASNTTQTNQIQTLMGSVGGLQTSVGGLQNTVGGLQGSLSQTNQKVNQIGTQATNMSQYVGALEGMNNLKAPNAAQYAAGTNNQFGNLP